MSDFEVPSVRKIHLLHPGVAERIAAGEVVERPSSVVKELIENSLDAGATEVAVTLEDGGKSLIEILDNGHGMGPEDLELCIERHATSKLSQLEDLEKISTLGFRGEALASVAACADLSILSRARDAASAYELNVGDLMVRLGKPSRAEKITFGHFFNSSHGTRIRVRGLFSQIPARLKFLKSQGAEVSQVREWMERLALSHPHVGFKLVSDDRTVLNLRPCEEKVRVQQILADGEDFPVLTVHNEHDGFRDAGLKIRVHWIHGLSSPGNKNLVQVVNSRVVRDRMLQQALLSPFRQALLPGQFPALALFMDINPAAIDVNVHPTKTEIRFLDSRKVFQSIDQLIRKLIQERGAPAIAAPLLKTMGTMGNMEEVKPFSPPSPEFRSEWINPTPTSTSTPSASSYWRAPESPKDWDRSVFTEERPTYTAAEQTKPIELGIASPSRFSRPSILDGTRHVGVLFRTYLAYENEHELILIDQHAAHERVQYEKLRKKIGELQEMSSQALLIPEAIKFPAEHRLFLESQLESLSKLGFEVEIFGEDALLFRGIPPEWNSRQIKPRLKNLVDRILSQLVRAQETPVLLDELLFESLASEACHSSVRAGDSLLPLEIEHLVSDLFRCEHPWNCPHGRPTVVKIPEGKLEEWFQRKV